MNTISEQGAVAGRRRRKHSDEFKAQVIAACSQPGVSIAAVSMAHGVNANLARRWIFDAQQSGELGMWWPSKVRWEAARERWLARQAAADPSNER